MIAVVVVDDERLVQSGFELILSSDPLLSVVGCCDGPGALALIRDARPDVVLLDIHMPGVDGLTVLRELSRDTHRPAPAVVMLTTFASDETTVQAMELGARGFLFKDLAPQDLIGCVRQAAAGQFILAAAAAAGVLREALGARSPAVDTRLHELSAREREVLALLGSGLTNTQIGAALRLSSATVKDHVSRILDKTGCENRTQAAVLSVQAGIIARETPGVAVTR